MDFSEQEEGHCKDDADDQEDDGEHDGHGARDLRCRGSHHRQQPERSKILEIKENFNIYLTKRVSIKLALNGQ